jgi:hypothetical protein
VTRGFLVSDTLRGKIKDTIARVDGMPEGSAPTRIETRFETVPQPAKNPIALAAYPRDVEWKKGSTVEVTLYTQSGSGYGPAMETLSDGSKTPKTVSVTNVSNDFGVHNQYGTGEDVGPTPTMTWCVIGKPAASDQYVAIEGPYVPVQLATISAEQIGQSWPKGSAKTVEITATGQTVEVYGVLDAHTKLDFQNGLVFTKSVDPTDPTVLAFTYTAWYGDVIGAVAPEGAPLRALHIGAGGLTMPRYLRSEHPGSVQLVLELDPLVIDIAQRRLAFAPGDDITIVTGDARVAVSELAAAVRAGDAPDGPPFDLVIGDAFGGIAVPWHLTTREFTSDLRELMTPTGLYLLNVIDHGARGFLRAEVATIADVFGHVAVLERAEGTGGNHVVIASDRPIPVAAIEAMNRVRGRDDVVRSGDTLAALVADAPLLTDDRAPVDQLLTPRPR